MGKITGALLSLGASGSLGKTLTFSKWRGIPYVRQHVIPSNPNTLDQQATRNVFKTLTQMWKIAGVIAISPWDAFATGRPFTGRNAFIGQNTEVLRGEVDQDLFIGSPGARGGLPLATATPTPGAGQISIAVTTPTAPTGWTLAAVQGIAFLDQDPADPFTGIIGEAEDTSAPMDTILITGLTAGSNQYRAWAVWTKPDGSTAYSTAIGGQSTVT
jgi:hypothetical protein